MRIPVPASQAITLWSTQVRQPLDAFAQALHKPLVLSEMGYRDTSDAGFNPYEYTSALPQDLQQQVLLFDAAFANILQDKHILGVFVWSWSNAARLSLVGHTATLAMIAKWYG